ncbi:MAG TPA: diaminopimelate epimerase [Bacillales bacterium]|nr:diaminopimelate epimerase [Bacillales bacterium]
MEERLPFTKMHGLGNCYIYVNGFEHPLPEEQLSQLAQEVSDPNTGIGADGLILIGPSETAAMKMRIFNKDGSEARNCGNGLRCVAKYAYENGLASDTQFDIETLSGPVQASVHTTDSRVEEVTIDMGRPGWRRGDLPMTGGAPGDELIDVVIEVGGEEAVMTGVSMGNPHCVFFVNAPVDQAPVDQYGPVLADHHPLFPEGVNVEFVEMADSTEMHFRVWERGSGITQACGTGACAAVVAAVLTGKVEKNIEVTVHLLGGDLKVRWGTDERVYMTGPAVKICEGTYFI